VVAVNDLDYRRAEGFEQEAERQVESEKQAALRDVAGVMLGFMYATFFYGVVGLIVLVAVEVL
jgi:hypothetical protein